MTGGGGVDVMSGDAGGGGEGEGSNSLFASSFTSGSGSESGGWSEVWRRWERSKNTTFSIV